MDEHFVHLLCVSDLHGAIEPYSDDCGDFPRLASIYSHWVATAAEDERQDISVAVLSAGDLLFGGSPFCVEQSGEAVIRCVDAIGLMHSAVGNHDWTAFSRPRLEELAQLQPNNMASAYAKAHARQIVQERHPKRGPYNSLNYPWDRGVPRYVRQSFSFSPRPGVDVFVFSLSHCDDEIRHCETCTRCVGRARRMVRKAQIQFESPLVVCLSHRGTEPDITLAEKVPGIHFVISGHSHEGPRPDDKDGAEYRDIDQDPRGRVFPGHAYANYALRLNVQFRNGKPVGFLHNAWKVKKQGFAPSQAIERICSELKWARSLPGKVYRMDAKIPQRFATARQGALNPWTNETSFGRLLAHLTRIKTSSEVGFVLGATIRAGLPTECLEIDGMRLFASIVQTNAELHRVTIKADQLYEAIAKVGRYLDENPTRSDAHFPQVDGLKIHFKTNQPPDVWLCTSEGDEEPLLHLNRDIRVGMTKFTRSMCRLKEVWEACEYKDSEWTLGRALTEWLLGNPPGDGSPPDYDSIPEPM